MPQSGECEWHLFLVAAAYAISDDIDLVAGSEEIKCGLCDTDVAFDADDDSGDGTVCAERIKGFLDIRRAIRSQRSRECDKRKNL